MVWFQIQLGYQHRQTGLDTSVRTAIQKCLELPKTMQAELQMLTAQAESKARVRHLRLHQIADAYIPGFGPGRINALAGRKVLTAADVEAESILRLPFFGPALTQKLVDWKTSVLGTFQFNPATAVSSAEQRILIGGLAKSRKNLACRYREVSSRHGSIASTM